MEGRVEARVEERVELRDGPRVEVLGDEERVPSDRANAGDERVREVAHGNVLRGIHPDPIRRDAGHPTAARRREVRRDRRVFLAKVGEALEGAEDDGVAQLLARRLVVKPRRTLRRDTRPASRVVDYQVEDELHPRRVQVARQRDGVRDGAELRLHRAVVGNGEIRPVPVVAARVLAPRHLRRQRRDPERGRPEVLQVPETLAQSRQVPAVEHRGAPGIEAAGLPGIVVRAVSVGEAIRQDEVEDLPLPYLRIGVRAGRRRLVRGPARGAAALAYACGAPGCQGERAEEARSLSPSPGAHGVEAGTAVARTPSTTSATIISASLS